MTDFSEKLQAAITEKRRVRPSSLKVYMFNIRKLASKMGQPVPLESLDWTKNTDAVLDTLGEMKPSSQKTVLASLVVALDAMDIDADALETYREVMTGLAKSYEDERKLQKKTPQQEANWTTMAALRKVQRAYKAELLQKKVFEKKELTRKEMDLLQRWIITCLYVLDPDNPPLRLDYSMRVVSDKDFDKLSEEEKGADNFLVVQGRNKKRFSLGEYKTAGTYGVKSIPVGKKLNSALNLWLQHNTSGFLLRDAKGARMNANQLSKAISKAFEPTGKKIGASLIRHIFISETFPAQTAAKEEVASKMAHSVSQQTGYSKK